MGRLQGDTAAGSGVSVDGDVMTFRRPGALYTVRWMAPILYSFKIDLAEHTITELPAGTITSWQQILKIWMFTSLLHTFTADGGCRTAANSC